VLALFGISMGIPSALVATRLIASMLFGLSSSDLPTITGVSLQLLLVALFAGFLPARRASGVDPMVALRTERGVAKRPAAVIGQVPWSRR
jgi:ABC-type antimicrobial peptide transport system permease subunit